MKKLRLIWAIPVLCLLLVPLPVYADEGCDGDCDMKVDIEVSGDSEVNVSTGSNSEVGVFPGENNNVYINGQDINQPTVIIQKRNVGTNYNTSYGVRFSKLESWRYETIEALQMTMDGLAKLIMISEGKNGELEILSQRLESLWSGLINQEEGLVSLYAEMNALDAEKDAEISNLKFQIELLKWENDNQGAYLLWLLIGLIAGLSIFGGLLYHRTKR